MPRRVELADLADRDFARLLVLAMATYHLDLRVPRNPLDESDADRSLLRDIVRASRLACPIASHVPDGDTEHG